MTRSAINESRFPWDPIWDFVVSDKSVENKHVKKKSVLLRCSSREKSLDEIREMEGSRNPVPETKGFNETREVSSNDPQGHIELDSTYFDNCDTDESSLPSYQRKVRFSPFKKVTLVEGFSFEDQNQNLFNDRNASFDDTWDSDCVTSAFSLGEFLQTWKDHLLDLDDSTYASPLTLLNVNSEQDNSLYESVDTHSFQSCPTTSNIIDESFSMNDTNAMIEDVNKVTNTSKDTLERNLSDFDSFDMSGPSHSRVESIHVESECDGSLDKLEMMEPFFHKDSFFILDNKLVAKFDRLQNSGDGIPQEHHETHRALGLGENESSRKLLQMSEEEKLLLFPRKYQLLNVPNPTTYPSNGCEKAGDVISKIAATWDTFNAKSFYEYEYEQGLNLCLTYKKLGLEDSKLELLQSRQVPSIPPSRKDRDVVILVEVSPQTEIYISIFQWLMFTGFSSHLRRHLLSLIPTL
jgi:hypothetical protein